MKVVPTVPFGAKGCNVTGRHADRDGFVQVNSPVDGARLHVSAEAVKIMGHEFGMVPKEEAIDLRFRLHQSEKDRDEALDRIADIERLESDLLEAHETLRERDEILAVFAELAEQGYTASRARQMLEAIERFENELGEAKHTIHETDELLARIDALANRRKVPA